MSGDHLLYHLPHKLNDLVEILSAGIALLRNRRDLLLRITAHYFTVIVTAMKSLQGRRYLLPIFCCTEAGCVTYRAGYFQKLYDCYPS